MPEKLSQGPRIGYDASRVGAGLSRGPFKGKTLPAAPWSQTWPAPQASLDLDFANNRGFVRGVGQGGAMDAVTFTRASVGRFVNEQGLLDEAANNQPRFDWASTAVVAGQNDILYTEEFDNAYWPKTTGAVTADSTTAPDGTNTADLYIPAASSSSTHRIFKSFGSQFVTTTTTSIYLKTSGYRYISLVLNDTTGQVKFDLEDGVVGFVGGGIQSYTITNENNGFFRVSLTAFTPSRHAFFGVYVLPDATTFNTATLPTWTPNGTDGIYLWGAQRELGDAPSAYIQNGAFSPTNTPLTANPTSNGLLIEESRTNRILWNRDATQANWVKTNVTAAKDQTGIDGVANAASSLTATSAGGTCIQTITLASGSRTGSVYLKRITGTGTVQVSLDGSTYSTVDLSDTEWRRIVLSGTVTNPTVGIKLATSGDAVAMDYAQVEDGAFATTPILTTAATVTRSVDVASITGANFNSWMNQAAFSFYTKCRFVSKNFGNRSLFAFTYPDGRVNLIVTDSLNRWGGTLRIGATNQVVISGSTNSYDGADILNTVLSVGGQGFNINYNGVDQPTNNPFNSTYPNFTALTIGTSIDGQGSLWVSRMTFVPKKTHFAQTQLLTGQAT